MSSTLLGLAGMAGNMGGGVGSPGQPTAPERSGGGGNARGYAINAVAAPLLALLGSKLSGGRMSFGQGLAAFGKGFADHRLGVMQEERKANFERENQLLDATHKIITEELPKLDQNVLSKFPALTQLSQKYTEALSSGSPGGKTITPKEQADIITQYHLAQGVLGEAKGEQSRADRSDQMLQQRRGEAAELTGADIPDDSVSPQDREDLLREGMTDISQLRQQEFATRKAMAGYNVPQTVPGHEGLGALLPPQRVALAGQDAAALRAKGRNEANLAIAREKIAHAGGARAPRELRAYYARMANYITRTWLNDGNDMKDLTQEDKDALSEQYQMIEPPPTGYAAPHQATPGGGGGGAEGVDMIFVPGRGLVPAGSH